MKQTSIYYWLFTFPFILSGCVGQMEKQEYLQLADATWNAVYEHYSVPGTPLLRETYPFDEGHKATYLDNEEQMNRKNPYSYLWPYSGSLSAVTALYEASGDERYLDLLEEKVLPGLREYYDTRREPAAYASYINSAPLSDRFYDDNVWLGLDFTDLYLATKEQAYLDDALEIWKFIESGTDTVLGGGIYWCEQRKASKNTCSNAPGAVYALKLYEATGDTAYLRQGTELYEWTKATLQDKSDHLYFDNKNLNGHIGRAKFAYNSGQMMQAAALLHKCTGNVAYLADAQQIAKSAYGFFFHDYKPSADAASFRLLNEGNVWFTGIMFRGFVELYGQDGDATYMEAFRANLDHAWEHMRDASTGLFNSDWSGAKQDSSKWLLTQFAMVEMYARMAAVE